MDNYHITHANVIGSADAAALLNASPYRSAHEVWLVKTSRWKPHFDDEAKARMAVGTALEPVILRMYGEAVGEVISKWHQDNLEIHGTCPHMAATPDGYYVPPGKYLPHLVEAKYSDDWDSWRDGPPIWVLVQVQHQMACTGAPGAVVVLWQKRLRWWEVPRNDRFIAALEKKVEDWWAIHVDGDVPPPLDGTSSETLSVLYPTDDGLSVALGEPFTALDAERQKVTADLRVLKKRKEALDVEIKDALGSNTYGVLPGGRHQYKWQTETRKASTTPARTTRVLRRVKCRQSGRGE